MSLSNPNLTNPAQHFFQWKGGDGKLVWWDKENAKEVQVRIPFEFIVLDELHTVTGYSDQDDSGFWSNETRSTREDFTVKTKRGVRYVGPYKDDKGVVQIPVGARYTKSIYIAHQIKDEWVIGHIKLLGAGLTAWIEFSKQHSVTSGKITLAGSTEESKGTTHYHIPTFAWSQWEPQDYAKAVELDKQLQVYLNQYLTAPKYDDNAEPAIDYDDVGKATPEQEAEYEALKAKKKAPQDKVITDISDEPINLDDIPF